MHKPFDLEAAKRGEPIEYCSGLGSKWESCKFLGISESGDGYLVVERINGYGFQLSYASPADLRMAPKKVTVRYRDFVIKVGNGYQVVSANSVGTATPHVIEGRAEFVEWIHSDWKEFEVPQ